MIFGKQNPLPGEIYYRSGFDRPIMSVDIGPMVGGSIAALACGGYTTRVGRYKLVEEFTVTMKTEPQIEKVTP